MHLADGSTPGANFFLVFMLGQFHIWIGFIFYVIATKKKDPVSLVFKSAIVFLLVMLVTAIGCLTYF